MIPTILVKYSCFRVFRSVYEYLVDFFYDEEEEEEEGGGGGGGGGGLHRKKAL